MATGWLPRNDALRVAVALAAWAAVSTASVLRACEPTCCSLARGSACCQTAVADDGFAGDCPACVAEAPEPSPAESCRCLFEGRDAATAVVDPGGQPEPRSVATAWFGGHHDLPDPVSADHDRRGVDRGALLPARPCRILYGVWRN